MSRPPVSSGCPRLHAMWMAVAMLMACAVLSALGGCGVRGQLDGPLVRGMEADAAAAHATQYQHRWADDMEIEVLRDMRRSSSARSRDSREDEDSSAPPNRYQRRLLAVEDAAAEPLQHLGRMVEEDGGRSFTALGSDHNHSQVNDSIVHRMYAAQQHSGHSGHSSPRPHARPHRLIEAVLSLCVHSVFCCAPALSAAPPAPFAATSA